ncbi:MAG: toll/interleukin-1 receptor domain-containing protein [candidate division KSB1 bacterium]|nr:toll/interleukin-1 receptor domain-containing protein [candidate division KSB1 bacterium]MDZ7366960.1 toll/interleukin-1 receptor domain-containing protein [candidate division KSB1 bacterium]MDZ7406845.1 toll/interleukin-1 receptor domain-containing protein [candidate division KSB1 bacterium]
MSTQFDYDVFLSHSAKDKLVVRELANRLKKRQSARVAG